jgi:sugar O-acyltransferase (sialic acid O-acetyltransferase NeuD family)
LKKIAIYGAGGFGRETALLIQQINMSSPQWEVSGFYDDGLRPGTRVGQWITLGGMEAFADSDIENIVVAIADPRIRESIVKKTDNGRIHFPSLIHPRCETGDPGNKFGKGCILTAGVIMTTGVVLGDFVILNLLSTIGHDVRVGDFSIIMPGCSISGNVTIGKNNIVGTGARILQNHVVGDHCRIGAGAVVTQNFSDHKTIVGIPAYEK